LVILAASALLAQPLSAQTCDRTGCGVLLDPTCGATPAKPVPPIGTDGTVYWTTGSSLQPADVGALPRNRDATSFDETHQNYFQQNWYFNLDIQNGYIFTALAYGLQIWDARTSPANPTLLGSANFSAFPVWNSSAEIKWPLQHISVPPGDDTTAVVAGVGGIGMAIFDTTDKTSPMVIYQSNKRDGYMVHASKIGTSEYAFLAANAGDPSGGLYMYNISQAKALYQANRGRCSEAFPAAGEVQSCAGVYMGRLGTSTPSFVDGVDQYVIASSGGTTGFEIWDATNPLSPRLALTGLVETPVCRFDTRSTFGVAMWKDNGRYFAGVRSEKYDCTQLRVIRDTRIYDVSCITGTSCSLGAPLWTQELDSGSSNAYITFSRAGTTPFLYLGSDNRCGTSTPEREWLFDVTNVTNPVPSSPVDITRANQGVPSNYWGWYYRANPTGFNYVMPRSGKFNGDYFYRTALAIFDFHKRAVASAPTASFTYSPTEIYPGTPVTFSDTSTGTPSSWNWTFTDGTNSGPSVSGTTTSTFATPGSKAVTLAVSNAIGSSQVTNNVPVLDPAPHVTGVTNSPASPSVCQPVTLTATGVTGKP
ncbi:MAG TPA: PKD domain-containing protein, partial [Thermoanaerobaculia bacterium]